MGSKSRRGSQHRAFVAVAVIVIMLSSAIPVLASDAPVPRERAGSRELRVAIQDDIYGLNPFAVIDTSSMNVLNNIYDNILNMDWKTQQTQPWLAVGWSIEKGQPADCQKCNVTVEYKLGDWMERWGGPVYFHDGTKVTLDDVLFSYGMLAYNPLGVSNVRPRMDDRSSTFNAPAEIRSSPSIDPLIWVQPWSYPPYGDPAFLKVTVDSKEAWLGVKKTDEHSLQFRLAKPYVDFFEQTLNAVLFPKHIWEKHININNGTGDYKTWYMDYDDINGTAPGSVGSGPFTIEKWIKGQYISLKRFDLYFDWTKLPRLDENGRRLDPEQPAYDQSWAKSHPLPYIDTIRFKIYRTIEAAVLAIAAEPPEIDFITFLIPESKVSDLQKNPNIQLFFTSEPGFMYYAFNMREVTFGYSDYKNQNYTDVGKPFRKAIAHSTDKGSISKNWFDPCDALGPVNQNNKIWHNDSLPAYGVNDAVANKYLDDAGWKDTDGDGWREFPEVGDGGMVILVPNFWSDTLRSMAAQMIVEQAKKVGINLRVGDFWGNEIERIKRRDFQMFIWNWRFDNTEPSYLYDLFHSSQDDLFNFQGYHDAANDALLDSSRSEFDKAKRIQLVKDVQGNIVEDLPYNVLCYRTTIEAVRKDSFTGWVQGASGIYNDWSFLLIDTPKVPMEVNFVGNKDKIIEGYSMDMTVQAKDVSSAAVIDADMTISIDNGSATISAYSNYPATVSADGKDITGKTDGNGYFKALFIAGNVTSNETVHLTAKASKPDFHQVNTPTFNVTIYDKPISYPLMTFKIDPDVISVGESARLVVTTTDLYGRPFAGSEVTFNTSFGVIEPMKAYTDSNGEAIASLSTGYGMQVPQNGVKANITVMARMSVNGVTINETMTRPITILPPSPEREGYHIIQRNVLVILAIIAIVVTVVFFMIIFPKVITRSTPRFRPSKRKVSKVKKRSVRHR